MGSAIEDRAALLRILQYRWPPTTHLSLMSTPLLGPFRQPVWLDFVWFILISSYPHILMYPHTSSRRIFIYQLESSSSELGRKTRSVSPRRGSRQVLSKRRRETNKKCPLMAEIQCIAIAAKKVWNQKDNSAILSSTHSSPTLIWSSCNISLSPPSHCDLIYLKNIICTKKCIMQKNMYSAKNMYFAQHMYSA